MESEMLGPLKIPDIKGKIDSLSNNTTKTVANIDLITPFTEPEERFPAKLRKVSNSPLACPRPLCSRLHLTPWRPSASWVPLSPRTSSRSRTPVASQRRLGTGMYFLRQVKFNLPKSMMVHFYTAIIHPNLLHHHLACCCDCQGQEHTAYPPLCREGDRLQPAVIFQV